MTKKKKPSKAYEKIEAGLKDALVMFKDMAAAKREGDALKLLYAAVVLETVWADVGVAPGDENTLGEAISVLKDAAVANLMVKPC
jgi:hypothetical protein